MNKKLIAVGLILVLGGVLLTGCLGGEEQPEEGNETQNETKTSVSPKEAFMDSMEKSKELDNYKGSGNIEGNMEMTSEGEKSSIKITGDFESYSSGDKKREDMNMEIEMESQLSEEVDLRVYHLPNGSYSCTKFQENWSCQEIEESNFLKKPVGTLMRDKLENLNEKDGLNFQSVEEEEVAGRDCNSIEVEVGEEEARNLAEEEGYSMQEEDIDQFNVNLDTCFDKETGAVLSINADVGAKSEDGEMSMSLERGMNSFETGVSISDEKFELPTQ